MTEASRNVLLTLKFSERANESVSRWSLDTLEKATIFLCAIAFPRPEGYSGAGQQSGLEQGKMKCFSQEINVLLSFGIEPTI